MGAARTGGSAGAGAQGWTGLVLALGLLVLAARGGAPAPESGCPAPREAEARAGHTVIVRCGEEPSLGAGGGPDVRGPARLLFGQRLDLGTVDAATLEVLPGVGPALAEAILRARAERRLLAPHDLARVPGIGERRAARLTPWFDTGQR